MSIPLNTKKQQTKQTNIPKVLRLLKMNKKGIELSATTIIISIIVFLIFFITVAWSTGLVDNFTQWFSGLMKGGFFG